MKLQPQSNGKFVDVEAKSGEKVIYDPADLGDLAKIVEYHCMYDIPLSQELQRIMKAVQEIRPFDYEAQHEENIKLASKGQSSVWLQGKAKLLVDSFKPYHAQDWELAKREIIRDLTALCKLCEPHKESECPLWLDDDPLLTELSRGFETLLYNVQTNKMLKGIFGLSGAQIKGVFSNRTFFDYLADCRTQCAQAAAGEAIEWIKIINGVQM